MKGVAPAESTATCASKCAFVELASVRPITASVTFRIVGKTVATATEPRGSTRGTQQRGV
jgi:hypothetical protein